jgi:L-iditol 2-dehydrogenase
MKALVLEEYNRLEYKDFAEPEIGAEEVLVRVKACGICGSDVHGLDGSTGRRIPPLIMGHEASGVIAAVGDAVTGWQEGERVTFDSTVYCGKCHFCRRGEINLCDNRRVLGVSPGEYRQHGAFAEYVAVPQHILYRLPDGVSFEQAATVEALSVAFHAVERTPIALNDTAVVVGVGMIGLLVTQTLRLAGCGNIIVVDVDPQRLELARQLGADLGLNPEEDDVLAEVLRRTEDRGADVTFEVVGLTSTLGLAIKTARKGGVVTLVGNRAPTTDFPMQDVVTRELSLYGSCASQGEYPACLDMISRGAINVDVMVSAVAPLSEGASWFQRLHAGEPGLMKVILAP